VSEQCLPNEMSIVYAQQIFQQFAKANRGAFRALLILAFWLDCCKCF
jgi:hypothetical protein